MEAEKRQACAVCGRPLEHLGGPGGGWLHLLPMDLDHVAIPVDIDQIQVRERCDFCSEEPVSMVVLAGDFESPKGVRSIGDWAACETCANLVSRRAWATLAARAAATLPPEVRQIMITDRGMTRTQIKAEFRARYEVLHQHLRGLITVEEYAKRRRDDL